MRRCRARSEPKLPPTFDVSERPQPCDGQDLGGSRNQSTRLGRSSCAERHFCGRRHPRKGLSRQPNFDGTGGGCTRYLAANTLSVRFHGKKILVRVSGARNHRREPLSPSRVPQGGSLYRGRGASEWENVHRGPVIMVPRFPLPLDSSDEPLRLSLPRGRRAFFLLDGRADKVAPFRPRAVVVFYIVIAEK